MLRILTLAILLLQALPAQQEIPLSIIVAPSERDARLILERLQRGEDFTALAREKSTDPSASDGGFLGMTDPAKLRSELKAAATGLEPGKVSGIARIPSGFAILKIMEAAPKPSGPTAPIRNQAIAGSPAVRLTYDFAGFASALQAVKRFDKPQDWDRDQRSACQFRSDAIPAAIKQVEPLLKRADAPASFLLDVNSLLADLHSYNGQFDEAIRYWQAAHKIAVVSAPERVPQIEEVLGVEHLQRAGGGLYKDFIFPQPLKNSLTRAQREDLAAAAQFFEGYLKQAPQDGEVRWLLALTQMLSGRQPTAIPPASFASPETAPTFHDIAQSAGLIRTGQAGGLIVDDFDNDGLLDIVMSSVNDCEPLALFHNNGDGTYTNRAAQAGLSEHTGGLNILQTDYNNDGCRDILMLRGGWEYARRKTLLKNNCDGTFTDVTQASGLGSVITATQTAVWVDIDNDGFLDLFVGNENAPAQLFHNNGNGTFTDIAREAGVANVEFTKGVVAADYDNDGYPDLYVSALNGPHHLYRNNHNRTFSDVTAQAGVEGPWTTFGAIFFDYDNDGWEDLFVGGYSLSVEDVMKGYTGQPQSGESLRLFHNLGNGKFQDVTAAMGLRKVFMPMGLNVGDIDNDGFLDFYLGSGNPSYASPIPNVLFRNRAGKSFVDVTAASGTGILPKGHGIAFADLDNDGDQDLVVLMGGAVPGDRQTARLFQNSGNGNDWLRIRLTGIKSNRAAIGARIHVTVRDTDGSLRHIHRTVSSGGSFGAGPLEQHFGLGRPQSVESVEVWWPASDTRQKFTEIERNSIVEVQEMNPVPRRIAVARRR